MAFQTKLALNVATLASAQNGIALSDPGRILHGFFINQTDDTGTTLVTAIEIWVQDLSGTYVKMVGQADPDVDSWFSAIGTGAGTYRGYLTLGDTNRTPVNSHGHGVRIPYVGGGNWRVRVLPTNGTSDDAMGIVALLSDGIG